MKCVWILLLLMLAVAWANPDSDDGDVGIVTRSQNEKKLGNSSQNDSPANQMIKKVRIKRKISAFIPLLRGVPKLWRVIKTVPRVVSPFFKLTSKFGKAMPYVDIGICIIQIISDCPTVNICSLKEELKTKEENVCDKVMELDKIYETLDDLIDKSSQIQVKTDKIMEHFEHVTELFHSVSHIKELKFLGNMNLTCAKKNDTQECLGNKIQSIQYVYETMERELNDIKSNNMKHSIIAFVAEMAMSTVGKIIKSSKQIYGLYGKPKSTAGKLRIAGKSLKVGTKVTFRKMFNSVRNGMISPRKSLQNKLGRIGHKFRSIKHKISYLRHPKQGYKILKQNLKSRTYSVRSVLGRSVGTFEAIFSAISIYWQQKQYSEMEDQLRLAIQAYTNDTKELDHAIAEGKELQMNYTSTIDSLVNQFSRLTETVTEFLGLFDELFKYVRDLEEANVTSSETKMALYYNSSATLLSDIDQDNIQVKQDQLLRILMDDLFNLTEMKSWVDTENKLFDVVKDGTNSNKTILYMCRKLDFLTLDTDGRDKWPILNVLCNLALFHPHHTEYDYYNIDEIRGYCIQTENQFPMNVVLLQRKNTMIQETIRRTVERGGKEDVARLLDDIYNSLRYDGYMKSLEDFPDEKEVLCIIAEMFPLKVEYGFYILSDFRPRSSCDILKTERFKQIKAAAMGRRNEKEMIGILLSPAIFSEYLKDKMRKHLKHSDPIWSICEDLRKYFHVDDARREKTWPIKELLCALGSVAPPEMDVYDHYPVDVIKDQCLSGALKSTQLQDILIRRKESLLEVNVTYHVDMEEEENIETMVKDFGYVLMSDPIMESLNIIPTEHEMLCIIADLYPDKTEYGMYKLNQLRPMERCEQITEEEFRIMKEDMKRRKFEVMFYKFCSDSEEPCFPMSRQGVQLEAESQALRQTSTSATWSFHATRNAVTFITLFTLQCML